MSYAVIDLFDIHDDGFDVVRFPHGLRGWARKAFKREVVHDVEWLEEYHGPIDDSASEHIKRAKENGEKIYKVNMNSARFADEMLLISDWIAHVYFSGDPMLAKLDRITWKQALGHSRRWHSIMEKKKVPAKKSHIAFDDECPVMLTHEDGMKWVWLKTNKARDDESDAMNHCVGSGAYDDLGNDEGVFSLRTTDGKPVVTVELLGVKLVQANGFANSKIDKSYADHLDAFHNFMKPKLTIKPKKRGVSTLNYWNGSVETYLNGKLHSFNDVPAVRDYRGDLMWCENGKLHRKDEPSMIEASGMRKWYKNGRLHREGGPAVERADGSREWYRNGEAHRSDGPAVEWSDGTREWWLNGMKHRDDGPAVIYGNGGEEWFVHGVRHRDDGPAVIYGNGVEEWLSHGIRHRDGGPAVILQNCATRWYKNGRLHRVDGPAVEDWNGRKEWYINGHQVMPLINGESYVRNGENGRHYDILNSVGEKIGRVDVGEYEIDYKLVGYLSEAFDEWRSSVAAWRVLD